MDSKIVNTGAEHGVAGSLCKLFVEHAGYVSDKWENYVPIYESLFAGLAVRSRPVRVLEIGVQNGGSLQIWSKYFPEGSTIVGVDINPACALLSLPLGVSVRIGDATSRAALDSMLGDAQFDVIIDDGSHRSDHIVSTFRICWERLAPGGAYVVEDLHCSYWKSHGGGLRSPDAAIEYFKALVDALNVNHFEYFDSSNLDQLELGRLKKFGKEIAGITFFDSLTVVEKLRGVREEAYDRVLTGRDAQVVDLVSAIAAGRDPSSLRKLILTQEASKSFAPALLDKLASAREEVGKLRADATRCREEAEHLRVELAQQSSDSVAGVSRATRELTDWRQKAERAEERARLAEAERQSAEAQADGLRKGLVRARKEQVRLNKQLDDILHSTAWRLSWPVRKAALALSPVFRRGDRIMRRLKPRRNREGGLPPWAYLFDAKWYLETYPDVGISGIAPIDHYIRHGAAEGRDPNAYFNTSWYLETYPDVAEAGMNPLQHYWEHGGEEGRNPGPMFDAARYLVTNRDVAEDGVNPLLHYLEHGVAEGRAAHAIDPRSPSDADGNLVSTIGPSRDRPVQFRLDRSGELGADDDVLIYVAYSADGTLSDLHVRSIGVYAAHGYRVILMVNSGDYSRIVDPGETPALIQIIRENIGFDFGAWGDAVRWIGGLDRVRSISFTNDSLVGPLTSAGAVGLRTKIEESDADVVFLTESQETKKHYQSYFFSLKRKALAEGGLKVLMDTPYVEEKEALILNYELPFFTKFEALGLKPVAIFPCPEAAEARTNPTIRFWRELCTSGFPFLKVTLISDGHIDSVSSDLKEVLDTGWIEALKSHLRSRVPLVSAPAFDANLPPQPAIPTRGRFRDGALQAFNPTPSQVCPVIVPFDDINGRFSGEELGSAILASIHCFYIDEAEIILRDLSVLPLNLRCLVTTDTQEKAAELDALLARFGLRGEVVVGPDRGRNLARFAIDVPRHLRGEQIILHIHTKKSLHTPKLSGWASFLRRNLIGSPRIVRSILSLLVESEIGVVYSEHFPPVSGFRNWGFDFEHARRLMGRMGLALSADELLEFPTGAMFWAKTEAISPLFDLGLTYEDFDEEADQIDGTLGHAIERCILYIAESQGFRHKKVVARGELVDTPVISTRESDIRYMMMHHNPPRLLGGLGVQSSFYSAVSDVYPVNVAPSSKPGRRLNILIPTMKPAKIYGGVATAMRAARALFEAATEMAEIRVIVTSDPVDIASMDEIADRLGGIFTLTEPANDASGMVVTDLFSRRHLPLTVRAGDIFFATAWWTADLAFRLRDRQAEMFGRVAKIAYVIQDYEAGFYNWSERFVLAQATLARGDETVALLSSEELANFVTSRHKFAHAFYIPYVIDPEIEAYLKPSIKKKKIIVYGRPSAPRNLFHLIVEGVRIWQGRDPGENCRYEVLFRGEAFPATQLDWLENARALGKNSLKEYAELLNEAAIGISLMVSPHPSYPPLDMATAGCVTITNNYESKDMTRRADNIISLDVVTPEKLADALDLAVTRVRLDAATALVTLRDVATEISAADYRVISGLVFPKP